MSTHPITGRLEVKVGQDEPLQFTVLRMAGREAIGQCFELRVTGFVPVGGDQVAFTIDDACASRCTLVLERVAHDGTIELLRRVHGVVASIEDRLEVRNGRRLYELVVAPRLWELSNVVTQEIFVGLSVPDVIRAKLDAAGLVEDQDYVMRLDEASYATTDLLLGDRHADGAKAPTPAEPRLVVQYRESDLAFVSRLAEHHGISFFFEHGEDADVVVFSDAASGFTAAPAAIKYSDQGANGAIRDVARRVRSVASTVYVLDYNYRAPDLVFTEAASGAIIFESLGAKAELDCQTPGTVVEYAPNVKTQTEADRIARVRADELESIRDRLHGRSDLPVLGAGLRVTIDDHPALTDGAEDVVIAVVEHALAIEGMGQGGAGEATEYGNTFEAVRAEKSVSGRTVTFRPPRVTPRPRIHGFVTGVVRGHNQDDPVPSDALASRQNLDSEGRYVVRLHFDQGDADMPRIRMAQPHAGAGYGLHFPLRPGVEVLVAFLDGDPDRPVIVGAVPNPLHRAPVRLETSTERDPLLHMNEMNRIETRSGVIIQIGDGDPPLVSVG